MVYAAIGGIDIPAICAHCALVAYPVAWNQPSPQFARPAVARFVERPAASEELYNFGVPSNQLSSAYIAPITPYNAWLLFSFVPPFICASQTNCARFLPFSSISLVIGTIPSQPTNPSSIAFLM